ncbi:MAG TPA: TonB-dependent receptor [Myxococcales bacterium]|nr:TonB-dependent receptor [Myxococcales bacterium]
MILALLLLALAPPPDTSDLEGLLDASVVSGASNSQESVSDAPATVTVVSAEQLRILGLRSLDEAINFLSLGMNVQNPLHSVELGSRGVLLSGDYGNHVLVRIDGHSMNEQWDGTAYFEQGLALPLEAIDHIELIVGPGSVLYGGNAMLGIINIVTRKASDRPGLMLVAEGSLSPAQGLDGAITAEGFAHPGASGRFGIGWASEFTLFGTKASFVANAETYSQSGPSFLFGPQSVSDGVAHDYGPRSQSPSVWGGRASYATSVPALYAKLDLGDFSFSFHLASYKRSTPYQNAWSNSTTDFDDPNSFERDRWLQLDARWQRQLTTRLSTTVHLYGDIYRYYSQDISSDPPVCGEVARCLNGSVGKANWGGLELQGNYDWTGSGTLTTLVGAEVRLRRVGDQNILTNFDTGEDAGSSPFHIHDEQVLSAWLQQRASPVRFLHLNLGVRFDDDSRGGNNLSPRAAAVVDLWKGGTAKLIYSAGYRVPSVYEAYSQEQGLLASPDLKPERNYSVEASLEQRHGRTHFLAGVFRSWWRDLIQQVVLENGDRQYQNVSSIENYGLEVAASTTLEPFSMGMTATAAHSRDGQHLELSVAPQIFGNAWVSLALPGGHAASFAVSAVGSRPADRAFDGNFPVTPRAPAAAQLKLTFSGPLLRNLDYRAGLDFNTGSVSPYVAGPNQGQDPDASTRPPAELAPNVRLTAFAGLQWRFSP